MPFSRPALLVVALFLCPLLSAQYTAGKIIFKNPGPYAQADLEAFAQLHPHDKVSHQVVQDAAQRLIDTGYFDDVGATLEGPVATINVIFTLKPLTPEQMTPVGFENFVWLTPAERDDALRKALPLFHGRLPAAGNQPDAIAAALQAELAAKSVKANVVHEELEPSLTQPNRAISFRVDQPSVQIHALSLRGVSPALAPEVKALAMKLRNAPYGEGAARPTTADSLLVPYLDAGYAEAKLDDAQRTVATTTAGSVGVDVSATVSSGEVYHVSALTFAGTPLISAEAVMKSAKLHPGDIASHKLLLQTLQPIDEAYRHLGYMDVFVDPGAKLDTTAHTVAYDVTVTPGEQYRVKTVTPDGLTTAAMADFDKTWRTKPGELYDPAYVSGFFKNNSAIHSFEGFTCNYRASADPLTHLVDLTLSCLHIGVR